jgi:hypothetical protein
MNGRVYKGWIKRRQKDVGVVGLNKPKCLIIIIITWRYSPT